MKNSTITILITLLFSNFIYSQNPHLDITGEARITGRLQLGDETLKNTVVGFVASNGIEGTENSLFGNSAGAALTSGSANSAFGFKAGFLLFNGVRNSFFGANAGSSGAGSDNSFFGSKAGEINAASGNSFFGSDSGKLNQTGNGNSFFGSGSGALNSSGNHNSYFGTAAGAKTTSSGNSYFGYNSGINNTGGQKNAFFGENTGVANINGLQNSFFGSEAGENNTASFNSFFGFRAGRASTGEKNTFVGHLSGEDNTGDENSFFGKSAGQDNTSGNKNTFVGVLSGATVTIGDNNTFIGYESEASSPGTNPQNQIVIGYNADGNGNNTATIGNQDITTVYMGENGQASVMSSSDVRMKKNIEKSELGLNFITSLNPVQYNWKENHELPLELIRKSDGDNSSVNPFGQLQHGLIAQEVKEVIDALGIPWQGWHENSENGRQALNYGALTVPLIKAIQEQQILIDRLEKRISQLENK